MLLTSVIFMAVFVHSLALSHCLYSRLTIYQLNVLTRLSLISVAFLGFLCCYFRNHYVFVAVKVVHSAVLFP